MTLLPSLNQCVTKKNLYVYLTDGRTGGSSSNNFKLSFERMTIASLNCNDNIAC